MSADVLRKAAALMRERAEAATGGPWLAYGHTVEGAGTVYFDKHSLHGDADHIASWHPAVALAVADWLDDIATRHSPSDEPVELCLHMDEPCSVCEDGGHLVTVCEGCHPTWDGMDGHSVYPCLETKSALTVAHLYLGEPA